MASSNAYAQDKNHIWLNDFGSKKNLNSWGNIAKGNIL